MSEGEGLGTTWCLATAIDYVHRIESYELEQELYRAVLGDETLQIAARPPAEEVRRYPTQRSVDGLLLALRDGYVRATGRRSTTRREGGADEKNGWRLHATDPTLITTDEWRSGEFDADALVLTGQSWQYIQMQVPDFMVKAIWPEWPLCVGTGPQEEHPASSSYTTPYLQLMQEAIMHFGLTEENQSKKENLSDWFFEKRIEGDPISRNIANSMATLIRLPTAQRGGAKRASFRHLTQDPK